MKRKIQELFKKAIVSVIIFISLATCSLEVSAADTYPVSTSGSHNWTNVSETEPGATINKSAKWTNIEDGLATITITEQDTAYRVYSPIDYIIIVDRSDSVCLDFQYNELVGSWLSGQSTCLNNNHYYQLGTAKFHLDAFMYGRCIETGNYNGIEFIKDHYYYLNSATLGFSSTDGLWNYHYNESGTHIGHYAEFENAAHETYIMHCHQYSDGCFGRIDAEIDLSRHILDSIEAYDQNEVAKLSDTDKPAALHSRVAFYKFGDEYSSYRYDGKINRQNDPGLSSITGKLEYNIGPSSITRKATPETSTVDFSQYGITNFTNFRNISTEKSALLGKMTTNAGGMTAYYPPLQLAYYLTTSREGTAYENVPVVVFFITDGLASDLGIGNDITASSIQNGANNTTADEWARGLRLTSYADSVNISGIYVGASGNYGDSVNNNTLYLRNYITNNCATLSAENGYTSNTFKQLFDNATASGSYTYATNRTLTDYVSDKWEIVSASDNGTINTENNSVTWDIGDSDSKNNANGNSTGTSNTITRTINVRLKDEYRYSDYGKTLFYETNNDAAGGCKLDYKIQNGTLSGQTRSVRTTTPYLKYGVIDAQNPGGRDDEYSGTTKLWTVTGAEGESVTFSLHRLNYTRDGGDIIVAKENADSGTDYLARFTKRNQVKEAPLIYYDEDGNTLQYEIREEAIKGYSLLDYKTNQDAYKVSGIFTNDPNRVMVDLIKTDDVTGSILTDAVFTVYEYVGTGNKDDFSNYRPYYFETTEGRYGVYGPDLTDNLIQVIYNEDSDTYLSTDWLIYSDINKGHFKIVETKTPSGYFGDWINASTVSESSIDADRKSYDVTVPSEFNTADKTIRVSNNADNDVLDNVFNNTAQKGRLEITKSGEVAEVTYDSSGKIIESITYTEKNLPGAWYIIQAAEDIKDREGVIIYKKGDLITLQRGESSTQYKKLSDLDLSVYEDDNMDYDDENKTDVSNNYSTDNNELKGIKIDAERAEITTENSVSVNAVFVTDDDGKAIIKGLPYGEYMVTEVKAPTGYTRVEGADSIQYVSFEPVDNDWTQYIDKSLTFTNNRQKINLQPPKDTPPAPLDNDPSIDVTKTADKKAYHAGETITYTVNVTNTGNVKLTDVALDDFMEDGLIFTGIGQGCLYKNGAEETETSEIANDSITDLSISANSINGINISVIPELDINETYSIKYYYKIPESTAEGRSFNNTVTAKGISVPDEENNIPSKTVYDNDDEKIVVVGDKIAILKEADKKTYTPGDTITYHVTVINPSEYTMYNVNVDDYFTSKEVSTSDLVFMYSDVTEKITGKGGNVTINLLESNENANLYFSYKIPDDFSEKIIDNKVTVIGYGGQPNIPAIDVTKSLSYDDFNGSYVHKAGDVVDYYITVKNTGSLPLYDVILNDSLKGDFVEIVSSTTSGTTVSDSVSSNSDGTDLKNIVMKNNRVSIPSLPVGGEIVFKYQYTIPEKTETDTKIQNIVTANGKADIIETDKDGNKTTTTTEVEDDDEEEIIITDHESDTPHISVTKKVVGKSTYYYGEDVTYEIIVTNDGNVDLKDVNLEDSLGNNNLDWMNDLDAEIGNLSVGQSVVRRYSYTVPEGSKDTIDNIVTAKGIATITDNTGNKVDKEVSDEDDEKVYIIDLPPSTDDDKEEVYIYKPSIDVTKSVTNGKTFHAGDVVQYHITVKNTGNIDLQHVSLQELLLDGLFDEKSLNTDMPEIKSDNGDCVNTFIGNNKGAIIDIGSLAVGETKDIYYNYTVKESDEGTILYNTVVARGETTPDEPGEPPIPVEDRDDEEIYTSLRIGVKKLMVDGEHRLYNGEGATFGLYAKEDIYVITSNEPIIKADTLIETGNTQSDGYVYFETDLPVGKYYVKEINPPAGCYATNAVIHIDFESQKYNDQIGVVYRGGIIKNAESVVTIELDDDRTMHELNNGILQVTDTEGNVINTWVTKNANNSGYTIHGLTPEVTYKLQEKMAPENYLRSIIRTTFKGNGKVDASIDDNTLVTFSIPNAILDCDNDPESETYGKYSDTSIPEALYVQITNDWVVGEVHLLKTGDFLEDWTWQDKLNNLIKSIFGYNVDNLEGAEFTIYAKSDILYPDGSFTVYRAGDIVNENVKTIEKTATEYSDSKGNVNWNEMYLGHYEIVETAGVDGYKISEEPIEFWLSYADDQTPIVYASCQDKAVHNPAQMAVISIKKTNSKSPEIPVSGAEIGLYAAENITSHSNDVIVKKGTLLENSVTDENGEITFETLLPVGFSYYVQEIKAPEGYLINKDKFDIEVPKDGYTDDIRYFSVNIEDEPDPDVTITVDKEGPEFAIMGQNAEYKFVTIRNDAYLPMDDFTLTDTLPESTALVSINTGTYSDSLTYSVYYRTNKNKEERLWTDSVSTDTSTTLNVSDLGLSAGEYVTGFTFKFGTVPGKFENTSDITYHVSVPSNIKVGTKLKNKVELNGTYYGKPHKSSDDTTTIVKDKPESTPKTGDTTKLWLLIAVIVLALGAVTTYTVIRKKKHH